MNVLHFQPISGRAEEIIEAILDTDEVKGLPGSNYTIHLVCEELVVNVVNYAYPENDNGYLKVETENDGETLTIRFSDGGVPFNPLDAKTPDITLPLEERGIGGLGIFLTKQMMDSVEYEYKNNENVLTISKKISQ